jgi:DNA polymerase I-like protein with 3'-5' exonuclease and polymerase domains
MTAWSVDSEYGWAGGDGRESAFVPVVFCALEAGGGARHAFWGRSPLLADFVRDRAGDLFVSHNLIAEVKYLLRLGVRPPARWWDTMLAFRYATNAEVVVRFGLEEALLRHGVPHRFAGEKDDLQKWIGELRFDPDSPDDRRRVLDYCLADCESTAALYRKQEGTVPAVWMRQAAAFALRTAEMERRGLAVDVAKYAALLGRKAEVVCRVTSRVNDACRVFFDGQLSRAHFLSWCARSGVGWPSARSPRTGRKYFPLDRRAFERMKGRHPFIAQVHEANKTAKQLNNRSLVVDPARGRHYFGNIPFGSSTGRTAFRRFFLSAPRWMRHLVVPSSPDHALVSADFDAEEIAVAAALTHDAHMAEGYAGGDPHMAFAVLAGAAPPGADKRSHPEVRARYKAVNLGVNYGQSAYGLSESTGVHPQHARTLLAQHRRSFPSFWSWTTRYTMQAFRRGAALTLGGWPRRVSRKDNGRSVANFAVQGSAADLMRLSVLHLAEQGAPLVAVNHDSFLFDCPRGRLKVLREVIDYGLGRASRQLFPEVPLRWTVDVMGDRYRDPGGSALWELVKEVLRV